MEQPKNNPVKMLPAVGGNFNAIKYHFRTQSIPQALTARLTQDEARIATAISPLASEILALKDEDGTPLVNSIAIGRENDSEIPNAETDYMTIVRNPKIHWGKIINQTNALTNSFKKHADLHGEQLANLKNLENFAKKQAERKQDSLPEGTAEALALREIQADFNAIINSDGGYLAFKHIDKNQVVHYEIGGACLGCVGQKSTFDVHLRRLLASNANLQSLKGMCELGGTPLIFTAQDRNPQNAPKLKPM